MPAKPWNMLRTQPSELGREGCAITLRKALAGAPHLHSARELAEAAGVNYNTLRRYLQGGMLPNLEAWQRIARALDRPTAADPVSSRRERAPRPRVTAPARRAHEVWDTLQTLKARLEPYKQGSKADREVLRRTIPGRDVGYVTSLLRALYDEDQFEQWILFSDYAPRGSDDEGPGDR